MKSRKKRLAEDDQLELIDRQAWELAEREAASEAMRIKLQREREEQAVTIPPSDIVISRTEQRQHAERASRGEIANQLRTQNRSLALLFLLAAATCALIWWGLTLMQGL
ncbi:MAG: hypothetical protein ACQCXQ_05390 [Verrucomicrobiales bacterium]|nr:hypothetical protein [Verrucomicrobiota bacterium JB025]